DALASIKTCGGDKDNPSKDAKDALLDKNGIITLISPLQIREQYSEGLALYTHHNRWGYIDQSGNKVIKSHWDWADKFSDQAACVRKGFKKGFIDHEGKVIVPPTYEDAQGFSEGLAAIKANKQDIEEAQGAASGGAKPTGTKAEGDKP